MRGSEVLAKGATRRDQILLKVGFLADLDGFGFRQLVDFTLGSGHLFIDALKVTIQQFEFANFHQLLIAELSLLLAGFRGAANASDNFASESENLLLVWSTLR